MKLNVSEVFKRASLQNLRSFLLHGMECESISSASHQQRMEAPLHKMLSLIQARYPKISDCEPLNLIIMNATAEYSEVYLELGLLAGIKAASELLRAKD